MKKLLCVILALVMLLSLAACTIIVPNSDDDDDDTKVTEAPKDPTDAPTDPQPTNPAPTDPQPTDPTPTDPSDDPIDDPKPPVQSNSWKDFSFKIDGHIYSFPGTAYDYINNGWSLQKYSLGEAQEIIVSGNGMGYGYFVKADGDYSFGVTFENKSANAQPAQDCFIKDIAFYAYQEINVELYGGITFGATQDQIVAAWGNPTETDYDDDVLDSVEYVTDINGSEHKYRLFFEDSMLDSIFITRKVTETVNDPPVADRRPAYLDEYIAPTALGANVLDPVVLIDNVLYRLPCPASEFLDNGWRFQKNDPVPGLDEKYNYTLAKGTMKIHVDLKNWDNDQMLPQNCAVVGIDINTDDIGNLSAITLSGNVSISMSLNQANTALSGLNVDSYSSYSVFSDYLSGETNEQNWYTSFYYHVYNDNHNAISIGCDNWAQYPWLTKDSIKVYTKVPSSWDIPGLWAWDETSNKDAFDSWPGAEMTPDGKFFSVRAPKWISSIIINGDNGTQQTDDIPVESGKDIWLIVHADGIDFSLFYTEPTDAELAALGY